MKKLLLFLLLPIIACQDPDPLLVEENERYHKEIGKLHEQLNEAKKNPFQNQLEDARQEAKVLGNYLHFSTRILLSDDKLVAACYDQLFENTNTEEFLYNLSFLINPSHQVEFTGEEEDALLENTTDYYDFGFYLYYLWKHMDKSPQNIRILFDRYKSYGFENIGYLTSGQHDEILDLTKGLVLSYEHIGSDTEWLESMYKKADTVGVLSDLTYREKASPEVKQLLDNYGNDNQIAYERWAYSFWVRRHHEGNAEAFYEILKEVELELRNHSVEF